MKVYYIVTDITIDTTPLLYVTTKVVFNNGGTSVSISPFFSLTPPTTDLLLASTLKTAIKNYVNSNYGTDISSSDVIDCQNGISSLL